MAIYLARTRGMSGFQLARDSEDALHKSYRTLIEGAQAGLATLSAAPLDMELCVVPATAS